MTNETTATDELTEIRKKLAELAERKLQRDLEYDAKRVVETQKRELLDEEAISAAEEKYGRSIEYGERLIEGRKIALVRTDLGVVIVKRPNQVLFKRFQDSGESSWDELDKLVRPCLVHPDSATFDRYLEEQPGIFGRVANAVATLAGIRMKEIAGKS